MGPTLPELLRNSRFEILPLDGIEEQVLEHLPTDDEAKLMRITMKIGVGESARYLRHNSGVLGRALTRRLKPDRLPRDLTPVVSDPAAKVAGFHIYTFNEVGRTERWRRRAIERLRSR